MYDIKKRLKIIIFFHKVNILNLLKELSISIKELDIHICPKLEKTFFEEVSEANNNNYATKKRYFFSVKRGIATSNQKYIPSVFRESACLEF